MWDTALREEAQPSSRARNWPGKNCRNRNHWQDAGLGSQLLFFLLLIYAIPTLLGIQGTFLSTHWTKRCLFQIFFNITVNDNSGKKMTCHATTAVVKTQSLKLWLAYYQTGNINCVSTLFKRMHWILWRIVKEKKFKVWDYKLMSLIFNKSSKNYISKQLLFPLGKTPTKL